MVFLWSYCYLIFLLLPFRLFERTGGVNLRILEINYCFVKPLKMCFKLFTYSSAHLLRSILLYKKSSSILIGGKSKKMQETKNASGSFIWEPLLTKCLKRNCAEIMCMVLVSLEYKYLHWLPMGRSIDKILWQVSKVMLPKSEKACSLVTVVFIILK